MRGQEQEEEREIHGTGYEFKNSTTTRFCSGGGAIKKVIRRTGGGGGGGGGWVERGSSIYEQGCNK